MTLNAPLTLTGSLRIDATRISPLGSFQPSSASANTIGRSLRMGMNGTALFNQAGNTLTVGAGVDDTLNVGVKDATTFSSVS